MTGSPGLVGDCVSARGLVVLGRGRGLGLGEIRGGAPVPVLVLSMGSSETGAMQHRGFIVSDREIIQIGSLRLVARKRREGMT